jgi:hypothetical protein
MNWNRIRRKQSWLNWGNNLEQLSKDMKNLTHNSKYTFELGTSWIQTRMLRLHQPAQWFALWQRIYQLTTWMLHTAMLMRRCNIKFMYDVQLPSWTTHYHITEDHNLENNFTLPFNLTPFRSKYFLYTTVSDTCNLCFFSEWKTRCYTCTNKPANVCMYVGMYIHVCVCAHARVHARIPDHCFPLSTSFFSMFYISIYPALTITWHSIKC